jgi:TetR/AcrR family transcriptional regulator, cholesterol catabolism regulator
MARIPRRTAAETDQKIRNTATALFFERGFHATTMRQIAAAAGIQAGSMYNHYEGKEELFRSIVFETSRALLDNARERLAGLEDPETRLRVLIEAHVLFHIQHRLAARISDDQLHFLESDSRQEVLALRDEHEQLFKDILRDGRDRQGWRVDNVSVIAFAIATMCTQVTTWFHEEGDLTGADVAHMFADFALSSVHSPSAAPAG